MMQIATTDSLRSDTIVASLQEAKEKAVWGTYGKGGVEHCNGACNQHPLRVVRLVDCSTEHLRAILRTQYQIRGHVRGHVYEKIIRAILTDRGIQ